MAATTRSLDQLDPAEAWRPWQPSSSAPWDRKLAAHLYRRAGFGACREDLLDAERLGHSGTLDLLLGGAPWADEMQQTLVDVGRIAAERDYDGESLRAWWLYCMLQGGHPLREKLTLFWHSHFATSIVKVQNTAMMFRQNCLLRTHALAKFGPLLQAISKDAAMMCWLDSNSNIKGRANENYARELMELFSLGVGHYTEKDVREAARAFTGWQTDSEHFNIDARLHDHGPKTVLGQTGNWDGADVVRIILGQPQVARFLVRKLYQAFISEQAAPPDALLEPLCESFRQSDYDVAELLKTMLASRLFYSEHAFRQRVKSPTEYVLGAVLAIVRRGAGEQGYQSLPPQPLVGWIRGMGQQLFAPPNVKGWVAGQAWLNTATVLERDNFAAALALGSLWNNALPWPPGVPAVSDKSSASAGMAEQSAPPAAFDPARLLQEEKVSRPEDVVRVLVDLYLPGGIRPEARAKLVAFFAEGKPAGPALERRVREAVLAMLTMAEYQLA
jgi:hypothetical protein